MVRESRESVLSACFNDDADVDDREQGKVDLCLFFSRVLVWIEHGMLKSISLSPLTMSEERVAG